MTSPSAIFLPAACAEVDGAGVGGAEVDGAGVDQPESGRHKTEALLRVVVAIPAREAVESKPLRVKLRHSASRV